MLLPSLTYVTVKPYLCYCQALPMLLPSLTYVTVLRIGKARQGQFCSLLQQLQQPRQELLCNHQLV